MMLALLAGDQTEVQVASVVQQAATSIGLDVKLKEMQPLDFSNLFYLPQYRKGIDLVRHEGLPRIPRGPARLLGLLWGPELLLQLDQLQGTRTMEGQIDPGARSTFDPTRTGEPPGEGAGDLHECHGCDPTAQ